MLKIGRILGGLIFCLALFVSSGLAQSSHSANAVVSKAEADKWREDLRYMADEMAKRHKNLFHAVPREQYETAVKNLYERIPTLARHQIIVELARIVALIEDGHTSIYGLLSEPSIGFRSYPLTLYFFKDGIFVAAASPEYAGAVGGRVLRIGNASAEKAYDAVRALTFHDHGNEFGVKAVAMMYLVSPEVLNAVGVVGDMERAPFVVEKDGKQIQLELKPIQRPVLHEASTWSHMFPEGWVDARAQAKAPAPLYLKDPNNLYWFEYLPEARTIYVQFNGVANKPDESVEAFARRLFDFVAKNEVERFVLDLRFNGGGNNYLNKPLIVGLIKSKVDERGRLFVITSRFTFSAAQNLVNELEKYTNTIFVGEPTGENVNFYGDAARIELPNSRLIVRASTLWWQNLDPRDGRVWTGPQLAAELTSADYFSNNDPAMKAILSYTPKKELTAQLLDALDAGDAALAQKRLREYLADPANAYINVESPLNNLGYQLMAQHQLDKAIEIFKLNVEGYPQSSNVYDSLGEAYMNKGLKELAIKNYEKSLELNPANANGAAMLKKLRGQ